ncbi:unnamed protein product [Ceutorhynchus assimilis]|uniref:CCHC-type domain-containing protein n=1 Tax=Ceutorhynchus assimilis TaxID=467358 RepID=A0A9N9MVJ5_9CUCU|nr:unnamed protein product [Ceutorhynchus assimilis]
MQRFQSTYQRSGESIKDYSARIERAGRRTMEPSNDPQADLVRQEILKKHLHIQLINDMLPYIKEKVVLRTTQDYADAVKISIEMENNMKTWRNKIRAQMFQPRQQGQYPRQQGQFSRQQGQYPRQQGQQPRQLGQKPTQVGQPTSPCLNSGKMGHWRISCTEPARCYGCQGTGHFKRECSKNGQTPVPQPRRQ